MQLKRVEEAIAMFESKLPQERTLGELGLDRPKQDDDQDHQRDENHEPQWVYRTAFEDGTAGGF
jgi:hypothetical protein